MLILLMLSVVPYRSCMSSATQYSARKQVCAQSTFTFIKVGIYFLIRPPRTKKPLFHSTINSRTYWYELKHSKEEIAATIWYYCVPGSY